MLLIIYYFVQSTCLLVILFHCLKWYSKLIRRASILNFMSENLFSNTKKRIQASFIHNATPEFKTHSNKIIHFFIVELFILSPNINSCTEFMKMFFPVDRTWTHRWYHDQFYTKWKPVNNRIYAYNWKSSWMNKHYRVMGFL